jgi:hypothetical protein
MKIISKADAMKIFRNNPGSEKGKFDCGRYKWYGSAKAYIGRDVPDMKFANVLAVYCEHRSDKDGPYAQLMSVHSK